MSHKAWEILKRTPLIDRRYLRVVEHQVRLPSGVIIDDFNVVESPSWAAMVCLTKEKELVLVEQYRHGHRGTSLELPAGIIDEGEDATAAAVRELREETGYEGDAAEALWTIRPEPARHDQWAHFAFVKNARPSFAQDLEPTESISVVLRPASELDAIVGDMVHGLHVAALLLAARRGLI